MIDGMVQCFGTAHPSSTPEGPESMTATRGPFPLTLLGARGGQYCWIEQKGLCSPPASHGPHHQAGAGQVLKALLAKCVDGHGDPALEL